MKLSNLILSLVLLVLITGFTLWQILSHTLPQDIFTLPFDFVVKEHGVGFNLDEDKFHFGDIPLGGGGYRHFRINNTHDYTQKIDLQVVSARNITTWFSVEPSSSFFLGSDQSKQFTVHLSISQNETLGNYSGFFLVKTYKAWPWQEPTEMNLPPAIPQGNENNLRNATDLPTIKVS
ncbi:hypothetical protein HYV86_07925 [Candidatus Woesearchaeota archaeon]|nr:hypothetical protein [Candidatus Woesearchaeota archaeon]